MVFQQKLLFSTLSLIFTVFAVLLVKEAEAQFGTRFSLSIGEEYNDNIFFEKEKEHDFITSISPTLSLFYGPPGHPIPTFTANLTPVGEIFARHSENTNFGDNVRFDAGYTYYYSPRLTLHASDVLRRLGKTRTGGQAISPPSLPATALPPPGEPRPPPSSQKVADFVSRGEELTNNFSLQGAYRYDPNIDFLADYDLGYTSFIDRGGNEVSHSVGVRTVYKRGEEHNLNLGYRISIIKSRNGDHNIVHNVDVGDDYFSLLKIQLTPTLTVSARTGVALNTGDEGPSVANSTNVTLTKVWETASLDVGVNKGLTPSLGISGISDTTSFFTNFKVRLTEFLTGIARVEYSLFDTDDVNFNTFQASAELRYRITNWLSSNLRYAHGWRDAGAGADSTDLLTRSKINSNSVLLGFTTYFNIWPNFGLAPVRP